jgi:hypothetical protein
MSSYEFSYTMSREHGGLNPAYSYVAEMPASQMVHANANQAEPRATWQLRQKEWPAEDCRRFGGRWGMDPPCLHYYSYYLSTYVKCQRQIANKRVYDTILCIAHHWLHLREMAGRLAPPRGNGGSQEEGGPGRPHVTLNFHQPKPSILHRP